VFRFVTPVTLAKLGFDLRIVLLFMIMGVVIGVDVEALAGGYVIG